MRRGQKGFILAEMALAVVIAGTMLAAILPLVTQARRGQGQTQTRATMELVTRAVAAYAATHHCLPCPAVPGASGAAFGALGTPAGQACGICAGAEGLVPFQALGLPLAAARDGWGVWLTMRVDPALTGDICRDPAPKDATARVRVKDGGMQEAALVLLSHGANGYGAWIAGPKTAAQSATRLGFPAQLAPCANGGDERCNADGDRDFVDADIALGNSRYDDVLSYWGRDILLGYAGAPPCHTAW
ncbi:MAG: type II secretion system protein [Alphaproteobacteria bacterium]|nr:MAG: type II secretion system protein [Alphaproteobacteria bacterium]